MIILRQFMNEQELAAVEKMKQELKVSIALVVDYSHDYDLGQTVYIDAVKQILSWRKTVDKDQDKLAERYALINQYIDPIKETAIGEFAIEIQTQALKKAKELVSAKTDLMKTYLKNEEVFKRQAPMIFIKLAEWSALDLEKIDDLQQLISIKEQIDTYLVPMKKSAEEVDAAYLQQMLIQQQYEEYVVTDVGSFVTDLPGEFNARGETLEDKIANLTPKAQQAYRKYKEWTLQEPVKSNRLTLLPPKRYQDFVRQVEKSKEMLQKISECSNFAYHAIGLMLQVPSLTEKYNICLMGIMNDQHNIAILLPKDAQVTAKDKREGQLPLGALIVDPWAVGLGYAPCEALAVSKDNYIYNTKFQKMTIHYQSKNDTSLPIHSEESSSILSRQDIKSRLLEQKQQGVDIPEERDGLGEKLPP